MDHERELLMIPGPTMVSPRVLRALAKPILSHGAAEFTEAYTETLKLQKSLFMSNGTPFLLAGSAAAEQVSARGAVGARRESMSEKGSDPGTYVLRIREENRRYAQDLLDVGPCNMLCGSGILKTTARHNGADALEPCTVWTLDHRGFEALKLTHRSAALDILRAAVAGMAESFGAGHGVMFLQNRSKPSFGSRNFPNEVSGRNRALCHQN